MVGPHAVQLDRKSTVELTQHSAIVRLDAMPCTNSLHSVSIRCNTQSGTAASQTLLVALARLQRLGKLSYWTLFFLYAVGILWWWRVVVFTVGCFNSLRWADLDPSTAANVLGDFCQREAWMVLMLYQVSQPIPQQHTLLMGVLMAPQSCHHSLFLLWWRPGWIGSVAFEAHAVDSQTALLHRAYTTSSQAVLSHMLPSITPLWRDWNKVTCSLLNLFFISF